MCVCRFAPSMSGCLGIIVSLAWAFGAIVLWKTRWKQDVQCLMSACRLKPAEDRSSSATRLSPEECLNLTNILWPLRRIIAPNFCSLCNKWNKSASSVVLHTRHQHRDVSTSKDCNGGSHHLGAVGKERRPVLAPRKSAMSMRECDSQYRHSPSLSWPGFTGNSHPPVYTRQSSETPRLSFFTPLFLRLQKAKIKNVFQSYSIK